MKTMGIVAAVVVGIFIFLMVLGSTAPDTSHAPKTAEQKELMYWACRRADTADLKEYGSPRTTSECSALYAERALDGHFTDGNPPPPLACSPNCPLSKYEQRCDKFFKSHPDWPSDKDCPLKKRNGE